MISSRTLATSVLCALLFSSFGNAQDLAKYRDFQFGMSLESVAKQIHVNASDAKTTYQAAGADSNTTVGSVRSLHPCGEARLAQKCSF